MAIWQARAAHLEERLKQLTADAAAQDAAGTRSEAVGASEQPDPAFHPSVVAWRERTTRAVDLDRPARTGDKARGVLRRLWERLVGR